MNKPLVLTFDCGTQSIRALLVDKQGNIVAKVQHGFVPYYSTQAGYAEQDPAVYWNTFVKCSKEILQIHSDKVVDIIAVTVTTIRDTCICVDKDGNELMDFIIWLDQRQAKCDKPLPLATSMAFNLVGLADAMDVQRKLTKCNWIQENKPEMWENTHKFLMFSGWLIHKLTGQFRDSVANQISRIPFDYKSKQWKKTSDIQYPVFNIPPSKLVELVQVGDVLGTITQQASQLTGIPAGLKLIATGSDKGCETLGTGVVDSKGAALSFGTTASVQISTTKYVEPQPLLPAYPAVMKDKYNPEWQVFRGYWMIRWFKGEFAQKEVKQAEQLGVSAEQLLNQYLQAIPCGCQGLLLQPYWTPALKIPEARGCIIGFSDQHTRHHIYRAIIEGIGFDLYDGLQRLQKRAGAKIEYLTVGGGGSQSDTICQITADMFGLPVKRIQTYEASGIGSSMVAFVSMGHFDNYSQAVESMVHYVDVFTPNADNFATYQAIYNDVYKKLYKTLRPLYIKIRKLEKEKN